VITKHKNFTSSHNGKYSALMDAAIKDMHVNDTFASLFDDLLFSIGFFQ